VQLTITDAHKAFKGVAALDGAGLELRPGEKLGLLGSNGAGKTTLVRTVSGRVQLDSGSVSLDGRALGTRDSRPELGIVPQEISVYPLLTTRQNLQVFGRFSGVERGALRERVDWALGWTGLADRADEPTKNFSGGMKRRVNIACVTLNRPGMLVLDEPTVGVDPQSRERIYDMLDELCAQGTSILLTTHQLDEAEVRCDRIIILDHGRTIAEGTLPELVADTIGPSRQVTIWVDREIQGGLDGFEIGADSRQLSLQVENVAEELSRVFTKIREAGYAIEDVNVRGPGLQAVFLHLTGRELRE
jgi:ABC-2 type transport system ATP-binding protein